MDPLTRKLFQPREAREKLRGMGGIMSSSPQLASTVAKFNVGGPIQAMPLASAIHGPSGMMYGEMSPQQLSELANSGDRLAAEVLMMLQPPAGVQPSQGSDGTSFADALGNRPRMTGVQPVELETTTVAPAPLEEFQENFDFGQNLPPSETGGLGTRMLEGVLEGVFGDAVDEVRDVATRGEQLRELREGMTTGPGAGLDPITGDNLLPLGASAEEAPVTEEDPIADTAPPAEIPAPNLDFEDPNTFDTNYKTAMSRLEGVMGTKDKSSREDALANLAMIGLAIAAGQSPNALTNIAQGALTGVKAIRAEKSAREDQDKAMRMTALKAAMDMESAQSTSAARALEGQLDRESRERVAALDAEGRGVSTLNRADPALKEYQSALARFQGDPSLAVPDGVPVLSFAQRLAAQQALDYVEGLAALGLLTPEEQAAQAAHFRRLRDDTLTPEEKEQAMLAGI